MLDKHALYADELHRAIRTLRVESWKGEANCQVSLRTQIATIYHIIQSQPKQDFICIRHKFEEQSPLSLKKEFVDVTRVAAKHVELYSKALSELSFKFDYAIDDMMTDWKGRCMSLNNAH